jgi:O-antigen/teichoic acid export membrane protein
MRSAIGIRVVLTVIGVAFAVAFAALAGYSSTLVLGTALAGLGLLLQLLQSLFSVTLQAQLRFGWASAAELVRQVVNVALIVSLVLAGAGILPLLAVAIPASAVSLGFTLPLVRHYVSLRPSFHIARWWRLLRETIPWAVISAVNIVYFRVAIVLMSVVASAQQTGYFATSFRITEVLVGIPGLVIGAAFPILVRAERDDPRRFDFASGRIFELALLAGTWLVLCLEIGAPFAIHVLAADKADPAIAVLRIQGAAVLATFIAVACGYPMLTLRRYRAVLLSNVLALAISATLTLALAPGLGARGAAIAALVAETGLAVSQMVMLRRAAPGVERSWSPPWPGRSRSPPASRFPCIR